MRKAVVAGIVGVGLLAGCVSPELQARQRGQIELSRTVMNNGEIISSVSAREGYAVIHTVRYNGVLYQCLAWGSSTGCTRSS